MKNLYFLLLTGLLLPQVLWAQETDIGLKGGELTISYDGSSVIVPVFSAEIDGLLCFSSSHVYKNEQNPSGLPDYICKLSDHPHGGYLIKLELKNSGNDTLEISNLIPFGENSERIYITAKGPWALARAKLFRPGHGPLDVTLPDNAWELGYSSLSLSEELSVCALARRKNLDLGRKHRYKTLLYPGGKLSYDIYIDQFKGSWQKGLKLMFQERWLYDLEDFDLSLYEREDLEWIRSAYLINLQFAWDHHFYDYQAKEFRIHEFLEKPKFFGYYDVYGIWPTWPRLGVDERNQWDHYRDLPGGLAKLWEISQFANKNKTRFFIAYNPWDQSTRAEDPYRGMANIIKAVDADGVVLDCRGSSSYRLQAAADSVKQGVVMYSEGMAIPKDMPGIVSGRVHDAIYYQPPLNLNKLIKPDFAIFRVCQLSQGRIHRETAISFFNGYGTEINTFAPGRPEWMDEEFSFLGKTLKILRENTDAFTSCNYTPLVPSLKDSIWVNRWEVKGKTLYTILGFNYLGHDGPLFEVENNPGVHYVDLWNHKEIEPVKKDGKTYIPAELQPYLKKLTGTRSEGSIGCIAAFPEKIHVNFASDILTFHAKEGDQVRVWSGDPDYDKAPYIMDNLTDTISMQECFGRYEGKIVIQLFNDDLLTDEKVIYRKPGKPVLISKLQNTSFIKKSVKKMKLIPGGNFIFYAGNKDQFIPYPDNADSAEIEIPPFYMDTYPVTNKDFYEFVQNSGYTPANTNNYLKHWHDGKYKKGDANKPVVFVCHTDAQAYAAWKGKRLPTEAEWQYAAQGASGQQWPWGNEYDSTFCNHQLGFLTDVDKFPEGISPFGIEDLVGNVWQMTSDLYDNGSYHFIMIRGGSYYNPTSSWWYVKGGPQPLNKRQMLLLVGPGLNRNATVGFRCVMDAENN